jgi:hypothetical protein
MNLLKIVFFVPEPAETPLAKGFHVLCVVEQGIMSVRKNTQQSTATMSFVESKYLIAIISSRIVSKPQTKF